jgi:AmmeMemoRadiSam system protein B
LLRVRLSDVAGLVGPSHFVGFDGVALYPSGGFDTPVGVMSIDAGCARAIAAASAVVHERPGAHVREHSLEMQLPFLARLAPAVPIVPLLMGYQTADTAAALGAALAIALNGRKALLIASTDLSHYHDATAASALAIASSSTASRVSTPTVCRRRSPPRRNTRAAADRWSP